MLLFITFSFLNRNIFNSKLQLSFLLFFLFLLFDFYNFRKRYKMIFFEKRLIKRFLYILIDKLNLSRNKTVHLSKPIIFVYQLLAHLLSILLQHFCTLLFNILLTVQFKHFVYRYQYTLTMLPIVFSCKYLLFSSILSIKFIF